MVKQSSSFTLENVTDTLVNNNQEILRNTQKNKYLIYTAAEACNSSYMIYFLPVYYISVLFWPVLCLRCNNVDVINGCNTAAYKTAGLNAGSILQYICINWGTKFYIVTC